MDCVERQHMWALGKQAGKSPHMPDRHNELASIDDNRKREQKHEIRDDCETDHCDSAPNVLKAMAGLC